MTNVIGDFSQVIVGGAGRGGVHLGDERSRRIWIQPIGGMHEGGM
jgi:hypothetical protein